MDDPELQPMVQRLMRIHVTEEARHIQFARDGVRKRARRHAAANRWWVANLNGVGGYFFRFLFTNKVPYRRVGLDAREARRIARRSPHRHEVQISGFAPLAAFLDEVGLMGPIARRMWRRTRFLPHGDGADVRGRRRRRRLRRSRDLRIADDDHAVRVRLTGHLDPIDGNTTGAERFSARCPTTCSSGPEALLTANGRTGRGADHRTHAAGRLLGDRHGRTALRADDLDDVRPSAPSATASTRRRDTPHAEINSGSRPSAPQASPPTTPAISIAKPRAPWNTPCALACTSWPTSDEIHAFPTPSVNPVNNP